MRATKPELVEIFKEKIIANASEILEKHKQAGSRPAFSQVIQDVDDAWSSGDEAPINLIKQKEEPLKTPESSPKRPIRESVTTSPKRPRKPRKGSHIETPIDYPRPEEHEQPTEHLEGQTEPKDSDADVVKAKSDIVGQEMVEKKDIFAKPSKPAPRKPRTRKPRADRSWIKPKAVHSGLTSDSDSDFGDRQKGSARMPAIVPNDSFPNFMDKSLLDLPDKPKEDIDTKADNHKSERKGDDDDEEYVPPVSPHSPGEKLRRSLRIRRANSKETNIFDSELLDMKLDNNGDIAEKEVEVPENQPLHEDTVAATYETVVTETEADDEAEPSAIALAKGKQRVKKHKQKKSKKPSPRLCQFLGFILTCVVFWYFVSLMTLPKMA